MSTIEFISGLMYSSSGSYTKRVNLSDETKAKLLALGIDITSVSSETEAKKIIENKEAQKTSNNKGEVSEKKDTSREEALYNDIKNLARKLGIQITQNDKISTVFNEMNEIISELKENSYNSNLNVFISEFDLLKNQFKNITSGESALLSAMDMISAVNKASFNL